MPLYEYKCPNCKTSTEVISSFEARKNFVNCKKCDSPARLALSRTAPPKFVGNGWYATDYGARTDDAGSYRKEKS